MTNPKPATPPHATAASAAFSTVDKLEEDASFAALAVGGALRAVDVAVAVLVGLLVCPPLAILAAVVVIPLAAAALVFGLIAAVLSAPYLLVHHLRGPDRRHASLLAHRLRRAGRALDDVLPHRIVADARKLGQGGP